ncbi:Queuine tRNA-ribosyltransferase [hydrothermal vent metagenome]|uniref:Queuine tRNA-ribosyltransferase n=1 Tax=hydrothermal vent metagenome TaxID=652676 RepID=A0A3B0VLX7_9ZZZZ
MNAIRFDIEKRATRSVARAGVLTTDHGIIKTPAFIPVATKASIKGVLPQLLPELGAQVVLANTYHLYLQPGEKIVSESGGVGTFMGWGGPTVTDSGGFQVFSLGVAYGKNITKISHGEEAIRDNGISIYDESVASQHGQLAIIDDEGVTFTSHLDGSLHRFTPERSVEIQHALGADIFFAFDECTSPTEGKEYQKEAMERTHRWAKRSLYTHKQNIEARKKQALFGIVQGGRFEDLRRQSAHEIASMDFDGFGIGGSFSKEDMQGVLQVAVAELPEEKPRHFLGIGEPRDVLEGISEGMDLFDCVSATRMGRHGTIYTQRGLVHLRNSKYKNDFTPLDFETVVPGTESFTRAYVSHLFRANEMLGQTIASMHNLGFIIALVDGAREAIIEDRFETYKEDFIRKYYA